MKGPHYGCPDRDKDGVPDQADQCPDEPEDTEGNERFHVVYYVLAYEFVVAVITASIHRNGYRFEIFAIDRVFEYPVDGSGSGSSRVDAHCFVHIELVKSGFVNN